MFSVEVNASGQQHGQLGYVAIDKCLSPTRVVQQLVMMHAHMFSFVSWLIDLQCTNIVCSSFHGMHTVAMDGHRLTLACPKE
jgi:hypothetical protein